MESIERMLSSLPPPLILIKEPNAVVLSLQMDSAAGDKIIE